MRRKREDWAVIKRIQESWSQDRFFKVEESEVYCHCDRKKAKRRSKTTEN